MGYLLKLGTFAKKKKSTAQPDTTGWAEFNVTLKRGSDLMEPVFDINVAESDIANYNYAYIFGFFYWIRSKTMVRENLCTIQLEEDVLANYKDAIGASNLFILRASAASNGNILDNFYAATGYLTRNRQVQDVSSVVPGFSSGVIVVNVMGAQSGTGSTMVQFTPSNFVSFINALYTAINGFQLSDILEKVTQYFGGDPANLVGGAMWFPYAFEVNSLTNIKIGSWDSGVTGGVIDSLVMTQSIPEYSYNIVKHPQAASRGNYLNLSPYTRYTLGVPCGGVVDLDTTQLIDQTTLTIYRKMEAGSGHCITRVVANPSGRVVAYLSGQMGIPINIKGSNNGASILTGAIGTAGAIAGAIATGGASAIIGAAASGIGTVVGAMGGTPGSSNVGAATIIGESGWLDASFNYITDEDNTNNGRPYCQVTTPEALGGYMVAYKAPLSISCTARELEQIERYLTTGFYYE